MKVGPIESLGEYLRDQRRSAELSVRQLAERAGVSNPYISQIERGLRKPSAEVLSQLAKALRVSAEAVYVRAGLLDPDDTDRDTDRGSDRDTGGARGGGERGAGGGKAEESGRDTPDAAARVRAAIRSDSGLTKRQRQTLLEIYESFRRETAQAVAEGVRDQDVRDTDAPDGEGHRGQAVRRPRGAQRRRANRQED